MNFARTPFLLLAAFVPLALAACGSLGPTPETSVNVHLTNRISNVVVTKTDGPIGFAPGSPSADDVGILAPCGGDAELSVPVGQPGGFDLVLYMDPSGDLDRQYAVAGTDLDPAIVQSLELSIMWDSSDLRDGQYVTVTPVTVVVTDTAPVAQPTGATCLPWAYPPS